MYGPMTAYGYYGEATATGGSPELDGSISINAGNTVDIR